MNHDPGVGHAVPLPLGAGAQQEGTHGGCQPKADGGDRGAAELHGVVDAHAWGGGEEGVGIEGGDSE